MRKFITGLAALLCVLTSASLNAQTQTDPPKAMLIESDPWLMVIGSDSPSFAMYDDGQVIYRTKDGYRTVKITPERVQTIIAAMTFEKAEEKYSAAHATDQPNNLFFLVDAGKVRTASIYGSMRSNEVRARVPSKIVAAYDLLSGFSDPNAVPWLPTKIEVMVWPYEYAPEKSIKWPKGWPDLKDPATVKRGESYSIFLASEHFQELKDFLHTRNERGAIEINGKKWAVDFRFPFPGLEIEEK